jgi:hypothetical protein
MSTRSLTHIYDDEKVLVTFYRQSDGYPKGHGKELAEFLNGFLVVNGLCGDEGKIANGMGCLAAFIIEHFKDGPGGIYIYPADSSNCGEEYVYRVKLAENTVPIGNVRFSRTAATLEMTCEEFGGLEMFKGAPAEFAAYLARTP